MKLHNIFNNIILASGKLFDFNVQHNNNYLKMFGKGIHRINNNILIDRCAHHITVQII